SVASNFFGHTENGLYYGVDVSRFRPADKNERTRLRHELHLPDEAFLILFSSRVSHEKDPETALQAVSMARARGLDARILNIGGGFREFLALAHELHLPECESWVIGRPAVNPVTEVFEYFRTADALIQASLAEGAAFSTLEGLASGTPVIATDLGGMAVQLKGFARLVPRRDPAVMAEQICWIAANREAAAEQALRGRQYVIDNWSSERAFAELAKSLISAAARSRRSTLQ